VKCAFSNELLALYVEGDLPAADAELTATHLMGCEQCRQFLDQLRERQSLLKSLRQETISPSSFAGMRREVLSRICDAQQTFGWAVKIERVLMLGFRRRGYAFAGLAIAAILSVSLLAQMRHALPEPHPSGAVFEDRDTLLRPEGYRQWVFVGASIGRESFHNVYINRPAYREYAKTGTFPEGTVMVREMASSKMKKEPGLDGVYEKEFIALEASVKDSSRFDGGWGFFNFTDSDGKMKATAQALPDGTGCRSCHEERAETDHVFTQFYPVLRTARAEL